LCHFITATLPQSANIDLANQVFRSHQLGFKVVHNPHVSPQLNPGEIYILTTRGQCDCGTALGALNRHGPSKDLTYESEVAKLRKQGWSGAKVQRWLKQKREAEEKRKKEVDARAQGGMAEAETWVSLVSDLLQSGHANRVGVLLHLYHGGVETERVNISERRKVRLADLSPEYVMRMSEDILYEFLG
jgi:hypothetical protein